MSLRRYSKRDKYAIPYNGEEVHLHWANSDQYYIKTSENFTDYSYRHAVKDGWTVHFKLRNADVEQNNVKGAKRFFVPRVADVALDPETRAVTVPFDYRPLTKEEEAQFPGNGLQEKVLKEASPGIVAAAKAVPDALAALTQEKRRDADGNPVGLLDHHLRTYTRKNTSDFFIHKDLGGFLERELDFYLKNEVLHLDELEAGGEPRAAGWFQMLRAIKGIGRTIIAFVAQIENFQKRIFEKKKFVSGVHYCVTLDRVPEALYPEIIKNKAQIDEWKRLFFIEGIEKDTTQPGYSEPLKSDFLKSHPHLLVDTKLFSHAFVEHLLESREFLADAETLDDAATFTLVHSEASQALRLLSSRFATGAGLAYIDPPYNTGGGDFNYKDGFRHSSWMAMMRDLLQQTRGLLVRSGACFVSIDENEVNNLRGVLDSTFGASNFLCDVIWQGSSKNDQKYLSICHEYIAVVLRDKDYMDAMPDRWLERKEGLDEIYAAFEKIKKKQSDFKSQSDALKEWFSGLKDSHPAKQWAHYNRVEKRGIYFPDNISKPAKGYFYDVDHPVTKKACKTPKGGYRFIESTMKEELAKDNIHFGGDHTTVPCRKSFLRETEFVTPRTVVYQDGRAATGHIAELFGDKDTFPNPKDKNVLARFFRLAAANDALIVDPVAGSGTTGHAVIDLNRADHGKRQCLLIEMGAHFDTVLKPRLKKAIYSKDWNDGKPVSRQGVSRVLKCLRLESYEDALDNIAFRGCDTDEGQSLLGLDDYVLSYMLDFETRESETLLNVAKLDTPFDYTLRRHGKDVPQPVDLPETFNYLIGLHVESRRALDNKGTRYLIYRGRVGSKATAILWRTTKGWTDKEFEADRAFVAKEKLTEGAEDIFVNTDSFIEGAQSLDPVFKNLMFSTE
ncbi:MAG: site-specific DNA-methyltransferase [Terrimicrobiaceae bacterium]